MKYIGVCLFLIGMPAICSAQVADSILYPEATVTDFRIEQVVGASVSETDSVLYALLQPSGLTRLLEYDGHVSTRAYSPGGIANFSVRGTGSQHTQVVWQGIPVNDPMLGLTDLSTISLSGVSSVRVLYGAAGLTNNAGGIGGTIELVSGADRTTNGFDAGLNLTIGSFGTYNVLLKVRDRYNRVVGGTSFEYFTARNNFPYRDLGSANKEERTLQHAEVQRIGLTRSVGLEMNRRNTLRLHLYYAQTGRELPPTMLMASTDETLFDRDIWTVLNWLRTGSRSQTSVSVAYLYGKQEYTDNNSYTFHHLYQANKNMVRYTYDLGHHLLLKAGADIFNESARSDSAYRNRPKWRFRQAAFASLRYAPRKWLAAQLLLREDVIDAAFNPVQGSVGVQVVPLRWLQIKANVARNFRPPTLNDLYWEPGGNPDLKSETGFTVESGIAAQFDSPSVQFTYQSTYFRSVIDNWIIWLPQNGIWTPENKRAVTAHGVETALHSSFVFGRVLLRINASHTWVSSTVSKGVSNSDPALGKQLIYVPQQQAKGNVSVHIGQLYLLYAHSYTGKRYTSSDNASELPSYHIGSLSFGYGHAFGRHVLGVGFNIDNLLDTEYQTMAWRPMPGRSYAINLTYQIQ